MKFTITEHPMEGRPGNTYFTWELWCGPADMSDHAEGRAATVHQALLQISAARKRIDSSYAGTFKRR